MKKEMNLSELCGKINNTINKWNKFHKLDTRSVSSVSIIYETEDTLQVCNSNYIITVTHYPNRIDEVYVVIDDGSDDVIEVSSLPLSVAKAFLNAFTTHMEKVGFYL